MVNIDKIRAGDRVQQNYGDRRMGTVIGIFHPEGDGTRRRGIKYQLDGEVGDTWDWFSSLNLVESKPEQPKEQPTKIQMDKQYRTRNGRDVRILCTDRDNVCPVIALIDNVRIVSYTKTGQYYINDGAESEYDLIEYNPAQELKLDQPIWVKYDDRSAWLPRHFAGLNKNGQVICWDDGYTSHTVSNNWNKTTWSQWSATKPE